MIKLVVEEYLPPLLACGAELKSNFTLGEGRGVYVSPPLGDLKDLETFEKYKSAIAEARTALGIKPQVIVHDLHPQYLSTKFAQQLAALDPQRTTIPVQHHQAHIASCIADNKLGVKVIGVAFDGTGYGSDGKIWGGEFFLGDCRRLERVAHFQYVPMPGGDMAVKEPYRMAVSYLLQMGKEGQIPSERIRKWGRERVNTIIKMVENNVNSPLTSSCGRLFDAVSSLVGICDVASYQAQAAIELEKEAGKIGQHGERYSFTLQQERGTVVINWAPMFLEIIQDRQKGISLSEMAYKFHYTLAYLILEVCRRVREERGVGNVVLTGGVFNNRLLGNLTVNLLKEHSFRPFLPRHFPPGDEGISLGQAVLAVNNQP